MTGLQFISFEFFVVGFPIAWCAVSFLLSRIGGWARLADRYRDNILGYPRYTRYMSSGKIGAIAYSRCLTLRVYGAGLRLSVMLPFRFGHPPIFIPWGEFYDVTEKRVLFVFPYLSATIGNPVVSRVKLPGWVRDYVPHNTAQH